jgi:AcrR family transcriptional regulator
MDTASDRPRREEYADQTRAAVIAAARRLFAENGFFQTKVEQIAKVSRVSPATVYAQCGGKQGLLRSLMDSWTQTPAVDHSYQESLAAADPVLVMHTLSARLPPDHQAVGRRHPDGDRRRAARRRVRRGARHRPEAAQPQSHGDLPPLEDIGALRDDVDARLASRIITYYYGIDGLLRTRDVFGWSLERSNEWLLAHASAAVLRSPARPLSPN